MHKGGWAGYTKTLLQLIELGRVPKDGARPFKKWPKSDHFTGRTRWWYYAAEDTREATDAEYDRLKKLYVERFGGWDEIDLDTTTYDGRIWW